MSAELASKTYSRPLRDVRREQSRPAPAHSRRVGSQNAMARIDEKTARAIFLSTESYSETARRFNVSPGLVSNIWARNRWTHATAGLERPQRAPKKPRYRKNTHVRRDPPPEVTSFLQANAASMSAIELARAMRCSEAEARRRCNHLGLKWRSTWKENAQPEADDDYEPTEPLPPDATFSGPPGSAARIADLADRVAKRQPLWSEDARKPWPIVAMAAFIEEVEMEGVS